MKKFMRAMILSALLVCSVLFVGQKDVFASQTISKDVTAARLYNYDDLNNASPVVDFNWEFIEGTDEEFTDSYVCKFTVPVKSILYVRGNTTGLTSASWNVKFNLGVYSDASLTNKITDKMEFYVDKPNDYNFADTVVVSAGTYYLTLNGETNMNEWYTMKGRATAKVGYIPLNEVIVATSSSSKTKAKVTVNHVMGSQLRGGMYRQGSYPESSIKDTSLWYEWRSYSESWGANYDKKCTLIQSYPANLSFKKGGKYTFVFEDKFGTRVQTVVDVKSPDKKKPTVTGVKNNKTYKKAVKIKFKDTGSGIKSAKLNGKKIKSGKKVKKPGNYKLVVTDNAGNKTTIKFKIKKK